MNKFIKLSKNLMNISLLALGISCNNKEKRENPSSHVPNSKRVLIGYGTCNEQNLCMEQIKIDMLEDTIKYKLLFSNNVCIPYREGKVYSTQYCAMNTDNSKIPFCIDNKYNTSNGICKLTSSKPSIYAYPDDEPRIDNKDPDLHTRRPICGFAECEQVIAEDYSKILSESVGSDYYPFVRECKEEDDRYTVEICQYKTHDAVENCQSITYNRRKCSRR